MKTKFTLIVAFVASCLLYQAQVNLNSSLTACYNLDGNTLEQFNGLTGTAYSLQAAPGHNGVPGTAIEFAGNKNSYVELPNSPLLQSTLAVSFSGWVYVSAFQGDDFIIFTKNNTTSSFAAYCLTSCSSCGNRFRVYKENGVPNYAESTTQIQLNTWYHVVFTIDNTSLKIYINGVLEDTAPSIAAFDYDNTGKTVILGGTNELNYNQSLKGRMDNLRFYNRILNSQEVLALYQQAPVCEAALVGISKNEQEPVYTIFPNPANDVLQVELNNADVTTGNIYSVTGALIKSVLLSEGNNKVSVEALPEGVYVLVLDGVSGVTRFVKN